MKKVHLISVGILAAMLCMGCLNAQESGNETIPIADERTAKETTAVQTEEKDKHELTALYHDMWKYMLEKNVQELSAMHADEFVLVHMTGMRQPKEEYLRCIRDGELDYFTEKTEHIAIEVKDGKGTLIGQSRVEAAVFGGSRNTWPLQLAFEVEKRDGKWVLIGAKASTY